MGDPFSLFTGAVTVGDIAVRTGNYLRTVYKASGEIDDDIERLSTEIDRFYDTYEALARICPGSQLQQTRSRDQSDSRNDPPQQRLGSIDLPSPKSSPRRSSRPSESRIDSALKRTESRDDPTFKLWYVSSDLVKDGLSQVERLEKLLDEVVGSSTALAQVKHADEVEWLDRVRSTIKQKYGDARKAVKLLSREKEIKSIRDNLSRINQHVSATLDAINLYVPRSSLHNTG